MSENNVPSFESINLVIGGKNVTLKVEDAKMLRDILVDIFGEPTYYDPARFSKELGLMGEQAIGWSDNTKDNPKISFGDIEDCPVPTVIGSSEPIKGFSIGTTNYNAKEET